MEQVFFDKSTNDFFMEFNSAGSAEGSADQTLIRALSMRLLRSMR
ncbi:hypothetical protein ETAC_06090 [Edwardsiella piscicida C07-087]|nr:hypothetical protein ETAC_06090 [Edwardsiella piscicida C07-087]